MEITDKIRIYNEDCLEAIKKMPDNSFDLAIVDPPYGLGARTTNGGKKRNSNARFENHKWDDSIPSDCYFIELKRVSKEQIIWGGNYFPFLWSQGCRGLITWDKMVYIPTMSQVEYAWYSKDSLPKLIKIDNSDSGRIHPTQKPVKLYEWLLHNYAKQGDTILDTHLGSGSIALACHNKGYDLTAYEIDKDYFAATSKRIKDHIAQLTMF
jgi:site-specific DNA-methyltransferase (adenine-specific)